MHGGEFRNIETIRKHAVWLALQKMFGFVCSDVGDGCEDIAGVGRSSFDAVSVVDPTLSSLRIHIKVL